MENVKSNYELLIDELVVEAKELFVQGADDGYVRYSLKEKYWLEIKRNELRLKDIQIAADIAEEAVYPTNERVEKIMRYLKSNVNFN